MTSEKKERLDLLLVELGLAESREKAQRIIRAGQVRHGTTVLDKPGVRFAVTTPLEVTALGDRFVSRGGWKLQAALDTWPALNPCPSVCADIGASTGGFTHCLLQHGAARVYTIDVGTAQLDLKLRNDPRVFVREQTNARHLTSDSLPEPVDLVVGDVSFISLNLILAPAKSLLKHETGQMVFLIKPQFEAGREHVGKGGVVPRPGGPPNGSRPDGRGDRSHRRPDPRRVDSLSPARPQGQPRVPDLARVPGKRECADRPGGRTAHSTRH